MFCRQCGKQLPDGAGFCSACGAKQLPYSAPKLPGAVPGAQTPQPGAPAAKRVKPARKKRPILPMNYIKQNVLAALINLPFCFVGVGIAGVALGVVGVVFGCKVKPACKKKDFDAARSAQKRALLMLLLSYAAMALGVLVVFLALGFGWFKPIE